MPKLTESFYPVILNYTEKDQWDMENAEFYICTLATIILEMMQAIRVRSA